MKKDDVSFIKFLSTVQDIFGATSKEHTTPLSDHQKAVNDVVHDINEYLKNHNAKNSQEKNK